MNISLVEGQCLGSKLPDTVNVAIQIDATSRIYSSETSVIQTLQYHHPIIHLNQLINYFDPRSEYIRAIIIEWSTKSSIPIARIISADTQCSLLSARRCENFDDYSQQVD
ncbi:unnamed protein product [Rotaria magnacalcarata]|uniref:Uncharacterized protein n=2 Tax=Rotaria magnacalcarata TaxID=392030 RepID=A0A820J7W7_9BILA|nr:unnamed protein product [Rotaria magnacalcarata]CAF4322966.1 unnamed protein product [Rotaria magnacalcarata]CAF5175322.1 unnamed protein product [Rotaria magnacalcarata]